MKILKMVVRTIVVWLVVTFVVEGGGHGGCMDGGGEDTSVIGCEDGSLGECKDGACGCGQNGCNREDDGQDCCDGGGDGNGFCGGVGK